VFRLCRLVFFIFLYVCALAAQDFSVVLLPDTQYYSANTPAIFNSQTQWIVNNASARNIKLVLHLGDIVNGGGDFTQWQNADAAMKLLDGKVPYVAVIGNHDYNQANPGGRTPSATNYNRYFGPNRYAGQSWYQGTYTSGSNENFYGFFTISGRNFLVMALEVDPRQAVLDWAGSVIAANPDREVIIVTHSYMNGDDTRVGRCDNGGKANLGVPNDNDGDDMWQKLVSRYPNISFVFSGHITYDKGVGFRTDLGVNGNLVNQMLSDYQDYANGGNGWLRILTFHPAMDTVDVATYSPWLNQSLTDARNQFTMHWHGQGGFAGQNGTVNGRVRDSATCANISGAVISSGNASATSTTTGKYLLSLAPGNDQTVAITASNYLQQSATVDISPGVGFQQEFFLSTAGQLNGTVYDSAGNPMNGATVTISGGNTPTNKTLTTDSLGTFQPGAIAVGSYSITASYAGFTPVNTTASVTTGATTNVTLRFASSPPPSGQTGAVSGTVISAIDGHALSGATVTLNGTSVVTNTAGAFNFANVPAATYTISAAKSGWKSNSATIAVAGGGTTSVTIKLATTGRISGTVKTSTGALVSGATVKFSGGAIANTTSVTTSSTGAYTSAWIPVGSYTVTVAKSGLTTRTGTATVTTGGNTVLNFTM
jgi:Carboxypeptidase regulatory-like domain/Calcineurin-like phosphoesterase